MASDFETPQGGELTPERLFAKCLAIAKNLWWSWHPEVINLFRDLDPIRWRQLDHNPIALLNEFTPERLATRAAEMVLYSRINHAYRRLKEYMARSRPGPRRTRACWVQAGRLFLGRVRHPRVHADLLGRPGRALRRPHQECQRPGRAAGGGRSVLRPGLFQAASRRTTATSTRNTRTRRSRTLPMEPALRRRTASRSRCKSTPATGSCSPRSG